MPTTALISNKPFVLVLMVAEDEKKVPVLGLLVIGVNSQRANPQFSINPSGSMGNCVQSYVINAQFAATMQQNDTNEVQFVVKSQPPQFLCFLMTTTIFRHCLFD
jgi:hypothetical protein